MTPFSDSTYLTQVRRLRALAEKAVSFFPVKNPRLHFINHGENTTFRVEAGRKKYLLRVHRFGYHTPEAIGEELGWLKHLRNSTELSVPHPLRSRRGNLLESVSAPGVEARQCDLLEWVDGRFIFKSTKPKDFFRLGRLMAELHRTTGGRKVKHRRYWDAEGLLGKNPKFGPVDRLTGVPARQQRIILEAKREIFAYLKSFERRFPERQSLIHADLHFGNFVVTPNGLGAIDFDDCGFGFHAYDLAIPLTQMHHLCQKQQKEFLPYADALQEGYASCGHWDEHDAQLLPYLFAARRILMLGWLQSRAENPKLHRHLRSNAGLHAKYLRTNWRKFT